MLTPREHADEAALSAMRMMQDVADGQLLQASNQAWHAAKHAVNAAAAARGRNPVKYSEKRRFMDELADEPAMRRCAYLCWILGNCTAMRTRVL